ncbi:MAG: energy transducer TonB [Pseudoxanthomonas spadix]|nr:MAG: energy transducer TonB [Pseudoxanthomonas spadix]
MSKLTPTALRPVAAFALLAWLAACSQQPSPTPAASTPPPTDPQSAAQAVAADAAPKAAVAASVQAMSADDLRAAATRAIGQNRLYAPAGDNAVEYYLALRDKQPDDPAVTSALTDFMPYTVIAAEQSIGRKDFDEARRLQALIRKADPNAPSLPRLAAATDAGEKLLAQQSSDEVAKAKAAAEAKTREAQRLAEQAAQQRQAADTPTAPPRAAREEPARPAPSTPAAAPAPRPQTAAAPAAEEPAPRPATPAASGGERRLLSAPPPRYPMDALRAGTSGQVVVEITIGGDGDVTNARVVQATPPRVFDRAALTAVKRWKFEPTGATSTTRRTIAFNPG